MFEKENEKATSEGAHDDRSPQQVLVDSASTSLLWLNAMSKSTTLKSSVLTRSDVKRHDVSDNVINVICMILHLVAENSFKTLVRNLSIPDSESSRISGGRSGGVGRTGGTGFPLFPFGGTWTCCPAGELNKTTVFSLLES